MKQIESWLNSIIQNIDGVGYFLAVTLSALGIDFVFVVLLLVFLLFFAFFSVFFTVF